MEEAIFRAAVIQLFAEISNRWNAKNAIPPKKRKGAQDPRSNRGSDDVRPPKKPPAHNVKNNCIGNCSNSVIQPTKTGLAVNATLSLAIRSSSRAEFLSIAPERLDFTQASSPDSRSAI